MKKTEKATGKYFNNSTTPTVTYPTTPFFYDNEGQEWRCHIYLI
jgi:hypothetical protein